ncbi:hypothetical protein RRG08_049056 [Elysia crispata]|uniref:Uncharacterized protein n=1 Tax=Elysia crispata TaxID=231223 RepID=A0AAE1AB00_9GAST|nr:hypothetical protein RRG08_049056 [Elysia crispata]
MGHRAELLRGGSLDWAVRAARLVLRDSTSIMWEMEGEIKTLAGDEAEPGVVQYSSNWISSSPPTPPASRTGPATSIQIELCGHPELGGTAGPDRLRAARFTRLGLFIV